MPRGSKIALDALQAEDCETLFRWINDAETVRLNAPYRPVDREHHNEWFRAIGRDPGRVAFAIRADDRLVGIVQLLHIHPIHRSAELVIRLGDEGDRGKGYGTEAVKLAVKFCWDDLNLQRVSLRVFHDNARAIAAYAKARFVQEGVQRHAAFVGGGWKDVIMMATLRPPAD